MDFLDLPAKYLAGTAEVFRRVLMVGNLVCEIAVSVLLLCRGSCNGIGVLSLTLRSSREEE